MLNPPMENAGPPLPTHLLASEDTREEKREGKPHLQKHLLQPSRRPGILTHVCSREAEIAICIPKMRTLRQRVSDFPRTHESNQDFKPTRLSSQACPLYQNTRRDEFFSRADPGLRPPTQTSPWPSWVLLESCSRDHPGQETLTGSAGALTAPGLSNTRQVLGVR